MSSRPGRVLSGRYRLVRTVGAGAQAAVWVAEHLALSTHVAVKLIDPFLALRAEARERFRREATAAAALRSPHVVQIIDHGIDEDQPFIVMELLEGEDLFERLEKRDRLSLREAARIVSQVARALTKAHEAGIVHRDLKPENVFLAHNVDEEIVKVLDFGVAKVRDPMRATSQKTRQGQLLGTPQYMSPEQVKGTTELDYRADLWALGIITFQCVTGDLPFDSDGVGDLLLQITIGDIPVPSQVHPGLPASFDRWFAKACARKPEGRFQSAMEMSKALEDLVAALPERAATSSVSRPVVRRRPRASIVSVDEDPEARPSLPSVALPAARAPLVHAALGGPFAPFAPSPSSRPAPLRDEDLVDDAETVADDAVDEEDVATFHDPAIPAAAAEHLRRASAENSAPSVVAERAPSVRLASPFPSPAALADASRTPPPTTSATPPRAAAEPRSAPFPAAPAQPAPPRSAPAPTPLSRPMGRGTVDGLEGADLPPELDQSRRKWLRKVLGVAFVGAVVWVAWNAIAPQLEDSGPAAPEATPAATFTPAPRPSSAAVLPDAGADASAAQAPLQAVDPGAPPPPMKTEPTAPPPRPAGAAAKPVAPKPKGELEFEIPEADP
jgi:serine/threonine protein kinase